MNARPRVAFIVQRYGLSITGGSEMHCREIAERMNAHFDVEVLTTCAVDHLSWKNALRPGVDMVNGVAVRRFESDEERHLLDFHKIYDNIFVRQLSPDDEHRMLRIQGPYCPKLLEYIKAHASDYDVFIFFTYMYYTTVYGLPLVKEKAIFVPTAHDEASLYLRILDELFVLTPRIFFNTEEERHLLRRRFNLPNAVGRVVGMGVDEPVAPDSPGTQRDDLWDADLAPRLENRYVLTYVGRVENGKGCDELVEFFSRFALEEKRDDLTLLLLGRRTLPLAPNKNILSPGYVSEYVKNQALARTDIAVAPSPFESLCIAALESWMQSRPLLVNGRCPVLVGHCIRSNGGLWYTNYAEFREALRRLLRDSHLRRVLGAQGRTYVERTYRWPVVEAAYIDEINAICASRATSGASA